MVNSLISRIEGFGCGRTACTLAVVFTYWYCLGWNRVWQILKRDFCLLYKQVFHNVQRFSSKNIKYNQNKYIKQNM